MKYDLHVHSVFSDGQATVKEIVRSAKTQNIGISITDHNEIRGSLAGKKFAEDLGVPFIIGMELGTREGKELLVYFRDPLLAKKFFDVEVKPYRTRRMTRIDRSMTEFLTAKMAHTYHFYFTALPHPYGPLYKSVRHLPDLSEKMLAFVDGIECINASQSEHSNLLSTILCVQYKKFAFASTDSHLLRTVGRLSTEVCWQNRMLSSTDISHNHYRDNLFINSEALYQIIKKNIHYSFIKKLPVLPRPCETTC